MPHLKKGIEFGFVQLGKFNANAKANAGLCMGDKAGCVLPRLEVRQRMSVAVALTVNRCTSRQRARQWYRQQQPECDAGLALLPGVATGSEIIMAQEDGFTELKLFPAMQAGCPALFKAWSTPFFNVKFCPTGGVTLRNAPDFLALPNVVCRGRLLTGAAGCADARALGAGDPVDPGYTKSKRRALANRYGSKYADGACSDPLICVKPRHS